MQPPPRITRFLLIVSTVLLFLGQVPTLRAYEGIWLAVAPVLSGGFWPWQVLTYAAVHGDPITWFFNMFALYLFGSQLENLWGERRYIQFVLACVLAAAAVYLLLTLLSVPSSVLTGAGGIVFGMLVAFGVLFPRQRILLFFVADVTMLTAVWIFVGIEAFIMLGNLFTGSSAWITDISQLGGALGGYLVILWWRHRPPAYRRSSPVRRVK